MDYKIILGYTAALIGFGAAIYYCIGIFKNKTKPHAYSWLIWSILSGIGFAAQIHEGGGAGSWVVGVSGLTCFSIFIIALFKGTRSFYVLDKIFLVVALLALVPWLLTDSPILSVIMVSLIDAFGFIPTYRKAFANPYEENASYFSISALKMFLGVLALQRYSFSTWFYPTTLVITNSTIVIMILLRRRQFRK